MTSIEETTATPPLAAHGLVALLVGAALAPLDMFVVNVALPSIRVGLGATSAGLEWVVAAYGLAFSLLLVAGGRLGDAVGRRRLLELGLVGFVVTSAACGVAPSVGVLVVARALQGASAAMLVPQALSIIQATTRGRRRTRAIGAYGATGGVAMVIGQLAGGLLVAADLDGLGWRPVFLVNVPIGLAAVILARRAVPESRASRPPEVDGWGTVLLGVGLLGLLVPLTEGAGLGWPAWCWVLVGVSPAVLGTFAWVEVRRERAGVVPLLPPSLLRVTTMRVGLAAAVLLFVVLGGFLFVDALVLQDVLDVDPWRAGVALAPLGGSFVTLSLLAGRLVERWGRRVPVAGGVLVACGLAAVVGAVLLAWPTPGPLALAGGTVLLGAGLGAVSPTLFRIVLSGVPTELAGAGSGVLTTTQQVATTLGVATLGTLFTALRPEDAAGPRTALVVALGVGAVLALGMALLATRLPDPRR